MYITYNSIIINTKVHVVMKNIYLDEKDKLILKKKTVKLVIEYVHSRCPNDKFIKS